ncbi:MAG: hypothetical protein HY582_05425, partial [Candidatus Omnitrophica bacterium]|nr:hypothetical protein [Candidatus Omnitrophota bacterium]
NIQLVTPFATVQGKGGVDLVNQKLEGVQLNADAILLDDLPKYFLALARVLPLNLGFSGEAKADLLLQGGWEQLEVGAKIDLSKALLTYSRYFNKPKSTPLLITTDEFTVKRAREFDGGVDITLADAKFKGSLVKFDIISKVGEATFVTNLIPLAGAQTYLPTFTGYEFTGSAKFFANGKGDFQNPGKMVFMYHTALDDVSARAGENPPLFQNLNGAIDGGPLDVETKDIRFDFGNTHFSVQIKMFFYEKKLYVVIQSPALDLRNFVLQFEKVFQVLALSKDLVDWEKLEQTVANLVQPSVNLENFTLGVVKEGEKLRIENLSFDVYGGRVAMTGWIDFSSSEPPPAPSDSQGAVNPPPPVVEPAYEFRFEIQNVSLARMLRRDIAVPVEGNLFSVVHVSGKGFSKEAVQTQLKGEGSVSITNGEFRTFDIVGSLGQVAELVGLGQFISGTTRFHDMKAEFQIANGKVTTDHIFLYSNDFDIDASGEADFDGNLNFRLDTVLSNALSRKIDRRLNDTDRLGPIPLLLTGKIDSPSLRPDPSLIQDFLRNLIERQLGKILAGRDWFKKAGFVSDQAEEPQKATPPASQETEQNLLGAGATLLESLFSKGENKSSST